LISNDSLYEYHDAARKIITWIDSDHESRADFASVQNMHTDVKSYLDDIDTQLHTMKIMIRDDYDSFIRTYVPEQQLIDYSQDDVLIEQFKADIFVGNPEVFDTI